MRLTGFDAIHYAEKHDRSLSKFTDPIEGARDVVDVYEASTIAMINPMLIYIDVDDAEASRYFVEIGDGK